jgi:hypothetical protein
VHPPASDQLALLDAELKEEMVASLSRVGRQLEASLHELADLRQIVETSSPSERRNLIEQYRSLRKRADQLRYHLIVQREAMGLRNHDSLPELYPEPPILK